MNRLSLRAIALTLCLSMLCVVAAGCQPQAPATNDPSTPTTTAPSTLTRPTVNLVDASGSVFLGTWNVSAKKSHVASITFRENGTMVFVIDGNRLAGAFVVKSDTDMTMTVSGDEVAATYTVDGDTITLTTADDEWILTKPE